MSGEQGRGRVLSTPLPGSLLPVVMVIRGFGQDYEIFYLVASVLLGRTSKLALSLSPFSLPLALSLSPSVSVSVRLSLSLSLSPPPRSCSLHPPFRVRETGREHRQFCQNDKQNMENRRHFHIFIDTGKRARISTS